MPESGCGSGPPCSASSCGTRLLPHTPGHWKLHTEDARAAIQAMHDFMARGSMLRGGAEGRARTPPSASLLAPYPAPRPAPPRAARACPRACTPLGASSITRQSAGAAPSLAAAARKQSGAGLPCRTSSPQCVTCARGAQPPALGAARGRPRACRPQPVVRKQFEGMRDQKEHAVPPSPRPPLVHDATGSPVRRLKWVGKRKETVLANAKLPDRGARAVVSLTASGLAAARAARLEDRAQALRGGRGQLALHGRARRAGRQRDRHARVVQVEQQPARAWHQLRALPPAAPAVRQPPAWRPVLDARAASARAAHASPGLGCLGPCGCGGL